jgi:multidrug efflux pump subunit AcrA (membrane-fusion protein)
VDERAIGTDMSGKYLLVVGEENIVELRRVELGPTDGPLRVITAGIAAGDQVVVEGILRARPGLPVRSQLRTEGNSEPVSPKPDDQEVPAEADQTETAQAAKTP